MNCATVRGVASDSSVLSVYSTRDLHFGFFRVREQITGGLISYKCLVDGLI